MDVDELKDVLDQRFRHVDDKLDRILTSLHGNDRKGLLSIVDGLERWRKESIWRTRMLWTVALTALVGVLASLVLRPPLQ